MMDPRQQAIADNVIHDEDHEANHRKLQGLYGRVAERQNARIAAACAGPRVLDVGAGYGNLTRRLLNAGFDATGIEIDDEKIPLARQWYDVRLDKVDIHESGYADGQFDTVIFREVIRHLRLEEVCRQAARIAARRVIVFQANPIWMLRLAYKISGHHEHAEYGLSDIADTLRSAGLSVRKIEYYDTIAFPLSGGYIGRQLVPNWRWLQGAALGVDAACTGFARLLGLGRWMCYRGLIVGEKPGAEGKRNAGDT